MRNLRGTCAKTTRKSQGVLDIQSPRFERSLEIKYILNFFFGSFYFRSETGGWANNVRDQVSFERVNWAHMAIYPYEAYAKLVRKPCENHKAPWIFNRRALKMNLKLNISWKCFSFPRFSVLKQNWLASNACDQVSFDLVNWTHMVIYLCEIFAKPMWKPCEHHQASWIFNRRALDIHFLLNIFWICFSFPFISVLKQDWRANNACNQVSFDLVNWTHMAARLCNTYAKPMQTWEHQWPP